MKLIIKIHSLVVVVISVILIKANFCKAECKLSKIFRTPRDFDHLEIVERAGFDHSEPSTTPSTDTPAKSIKKNGNNYANAQVSVRFGTDYGSSHVMKIPPQCRNLIGNGINHFPDTIPSPNFFYPPPPHRIPPPCLPHQYYHPYPPPVPYVFPNYYFWGPREESAYLPPQLNEYFRRHPDFVLTKHPYDEEAFIGDRPVWRGDVGKTVIPAEFVNANITPVKITEHLNVLPNNLPVGRPVHAITSRILRPCDPTNGTNKNIQEIRRQRTSLQMENHDEVGNDISVEFFHSFEDLPYQKYDQLQTNEKSELKIPKPCTQKVQKRIYNPYEIKITKPSAQDVQKQVDNISESDIPEPNKEFGNDLEKLLIESLVEYKDNNSTGPSKMLVSYPIINKDDTTKDIKTKQVKFVNDIDSLASLNTENIVDGGTHKNCECNSSITNIPTGKSCVKDVDDLVSILIKIIDLGKSLHATPKPNSPDISSLLSKIIPSLAQPFIPDVSLLYPDIIYPFNQIPPKPLSAIFNLPLSSYDSTDSQRASSTSPYSSTSEEGGKSGPKTIILCHSSVEEKALDPNDRFPNADPKMEYGRYTQPETSLSTKECPLPIYLKLIPVTPEVNSATIIATPPNPESSRKSENFPPAPTAINEPKLQLSNAFPPEVISLKEDNTSLQYMQVAPRADLELVDSKENVFPAVISYSHIPAAASSSSQPESIYCRKCDLKHSGGNYCDKCGYPLMFYPDHVDCPTCPK